MALLLKDNLNIVSAMRMTLRILMVLMLSCATGSIQAQFSCGSGTPIFDVDLSNDPNATWTSPDTVRIDTCCGAVAPDKCVGFEVTLHPNAEGIIFDICDGAIPPGAIFYQVNCGSPTPVGEALCLNGVGPHYITFCKPGNNSNRYCITSIAEPTPGPNVAVNDGCSGQLWVAGFDPDSLTWSSVFPGPAGVYDTLLDCTSGCDTVNIVGGNNLPDSVVWQACGPLLGDCDTANYCVEMTSYFFNTLEAVISPLNPTVCFGSPGTWIYAGGAGGSPPYTFSWNTGSTQDSIFVGVGTYILEVGDTSGCPPAYDTVFVDSFSMPIQANAGNDTVYCNTLLPIQLNGSVQAATGGVWLGGDGTFTPDSFNLNASYAPGPQDSTNGFVDLYLITTGNGTCPPDTDTVSIDLHVYSSTVNLITEDVSCFGGSNGTARANLISGISIDQFEWQINPVQLGDSVDGLSAGTYDILITDSLGCDTTMSFTINEPPELILTNNGVTDASCPAAADGDATVGASGGTPPYTYNWSSGSTTATAVGLAAGSYTVTVQDVNGCMDSLSFLIEEPPGININLAAVDVDCFESNTGSIATFVIPAGAYTYNWSNGGTTQIINNLFAGTYTLTVTFGNNCLDSATATLVEPDSLGVSLFDTNITCHGANDGIIATTVVGGVGPYQYAWSTTSTANQLNGLAAGSYTLTVTDANGCDRIDSANILEPDSLIINESAYDISCYEGSDGAIASNVSGGTLPYSYLWSTGNTSDSIAGLTAGSYSVVVTDSNACTDTSFVVLTEPTELATSLLADDVSCFDGTDGFAIAVTGGGVAPYQYIWSNGGVMDTASNLTAGSYVVTVTDANGCTTVNDTTLTQPEAIEVQMSDPQEICLNTSAIIFASASGGNGGYAYTWNNGLPGQNSHVVSPTITTVYSVSVTDSLGCPPAVGNVQIRVTPVDFDDLNVLADPDEICIGKSTEITATYGGDISAFDVSWNIQQFGSNLGPFNVSPDSSAFYIITLTDECGFTSVDSIFLRVNPVPQLDFPGVLHEGCAPFEVTFDDGIDDVEIGKYEWDLGNGQTSAKENPTTIYPNAGTYQISLSVTSNRGCKSEGNGEGVIEVRPSPTAAFKVVPEEVTTDNPVIETQDGSLDAVSYDWTVSDGASYTGSSIQHTFQDWGNYLIELSVLNAYGCEDTTSRKVYVAPVLNLEAPTAFTPNPNGPSSGYFDPSAMNNDVFYLITEFVSTFHLVVYNRWGEVVFESFDPFFGWNGYYKNELAPMAMYTWRADVEFVDGRSVIETGYVTLLR